MWSARNTKTHKEFFVATFGHMMLRIIRIIIWQIVGVFMIKMQEFFQNNFSEIDF